MQRLAQEEENSAGAAVDRKWLLCILKGKKKKKGPP